MQGEVQPGPDLDEAPRSFAGRCNPASDPVSRSAGTEPGTKFPSLRLNARVDTITGFAIMDTQ